MRQSISVRVDEADYRKLEGLAARRGRPVAELVREAIATYLEPGRGGGKPVVEVRARGRGRQLAGWTRSEIYDETLGAGRRK